MKPQILQRVVERLVYEGLLVHNQYHGRRWRVTLSELLTAGELEPRVLELLPGIIVHRPTLLYRLSRDVSKCPEVRQLMQWITEIPTDRMWRGVPIRDMQRAAQRVADIHHHRRRQQRWRTVNIRVSEQDLERLQRLAARKGQTKSEVLRTLIARAERE